MLLCRDRARLVISWKKRQKWFYFPLFFLDFFPCDQGRPNTTLAWPGGCTCVSVWPPPDVAAPLLPTTKTTFHNILPSFICVPSFTSYFATFVCSSHLLIMLRLLFKFQWARGSLSDGVSYRKWQLWRDFFSFSFTTAFCCYYSLLHGCDATFGWQATWENFSDANQLAPDSCRLNNFLVTKHSPLIFTPIDSSRKALSDIFWLQLDPVKRSDVKLRKSYGDRWRALSICDLWLNLN